MFIDISGNSVILAEINFRKVYSCTLFSMKYCGSTKSHETPLARKKV